MADNNDLLLIEAQLLQQENDIAGAQKLYLQILKNDPHYVAALRYLALTYVQNNEYAQAIATFLQAIKLQDDPILHMNLANVYKIQQDVANAILHYEIALKLEPNYAKAYNNLAGLYADQGEYNKALHAYRAAVHADPSFTLAHLNLGILLFNHQDVSNAITQFNNVLALDDGHILALFYLGLIELSADNLDMAENYFQQIISIDAEHVQSLVNLGVIALKKSQSQAAIDYFTKALALDEDNIEARNNLAATFIHFDRFENALRYYQELLVLEPHNIEYLYNTGVAEMGLGHIDKAQQYFGHVLQIDETHFGALSNLAAIKLRIDDRAAAIALLERALIVEPDSKTSRFMLQALVKDYREVDTCIEYAHDLFEHYAMYYDQHMQSVLDYAIPHKLWEVLSELGTAEYNSILDLGCGTGLCADVLVAYTERLIGVDISAKMLDVAKAKGKYAELYAVDINKFLLDCRQKHALVVAADVMPYFGSLEDVFVNVANVLDNAGLFIFSIEIAEDKDWQLQDNMRFCHSPQYIQKLAQRIGFEIIYVDKFRARNQENEPVYEQMYVLQPSQQMLLVH